MVLLDLCFGFHQLWLSKEHQGRVSTNAPPYSEGFSKLRLECGELKLKTGSHNDRIQVVMFASSALQSTTEQSHPPFSIPPNYDISFVFFMCYYFEGAVSWSNYLNLLVIQLLIPLLSPE